ncbi:MAG: hypothetical protein ACQEQH_05580 [Bacillota bacterium]
MKKNSYKTPYVLSYIIILLTLIATLSGVFVKEMYQDNLLVVSAWTGTDIITLILGIPIFIYALVLFKKKQILGLLLIFSMIFYSFYNYAFYLFSAALNSMFLIYVTIFTLSFYSILIIIRKIDVDSIARKFKEKTPVKLIGGFMIVVGIILGIFHISLSLSYVLTGKVPEIVVNVNHPTNIIAALDLSLVVPVALFGGYSIINKKRWGYLISVIWNVKGFVYMFALSSAAITTYINGAVDSLMELMLWGPIGIGCLIMSYLLIKNIKEDSKFY